MTDSLVARMIKKVEEEDLVSGTFTWRVDNFSQLKKYQHYSEVFVIGGYKWRMLIYARGNNVDCLSVYLDVAEASTLPYGWNRYTKFKLTLVDQFDTNKSITKDLEHTFTASTVDWGLTSFIPLSELHRHDKGYLVNDVCVVEVEVSVRNGIKILEDQETALGRVLHFLKTTKAKDMNADACQRLQLLWEELEAFKFDLAWLEPHVQSVFGMTKKVGIVNRLKEDVDVLDNEIKTRRAILADAEAELEVAKRNLAEAEEEYFSKIDMDSELGYPLA
ncbi:hypothetical protein ACFX1Q_039938 [Malus domestica]